MEVSFDLKSYSNCVAVDVQTLVCDAHVYDTHTHSSAASVTRRRYKFYFTICRLSRVRESDRNSRHARARARARLRAFESLIYCAMRSVERGELFRSGSAKSSPECLYYEV